MVKPRVLLLALALASATLQAAVQSPETLELQPRMEQRYATNLATRFLTNWHYKDTRLDVGWREP